MSKSKTFRQIIFFARLVNYEKILSCYFFLFFPSKDLCALRFLNGFEGIPFKDMEYVEDSLILLTRLKEGIFHQRFRKTSN